MYTRVLMLLGVVIASATPALAQFISGSDGSDGAFAPSEPDTVVDLSLAATASWDTPSPVPGQGVYDPDQWAVVFKYTTVSIPVGVTVTFLNHPSGAPVVWLTTGDVDIEGVVNLDGEGYFRPSFPYTYSEPGPGGFAGGAPYFSSILRQSGGFGPGGGDYDNGGDYGTGTFAYGSPNILPLIGGSGGGGSPSSQPGDCVGGAAGGAILIASSGTITVLSTGQISARGGDGYYYTGGGSGGAIRLVANQIGGSGSLLATASSGHNPGTSGRIRLEAYTNAFTGSANPTLTFSVPGSVFPSSSAPTLRATTIGGKPVPADPKAGVREVGVAVSTGEVVLEIEATNIPVGTSVTVLVKPAHDAPFTVTSDPLAGTLASSTAQASLSLPDGPVEIQLRANWEP